MHIHSGDWILQKVAAVGLSIIEVWNYQLAESDTKWDRLIYSI